MGTPPQVARIPRLTRAKVEDNPRLGGAVFRREVALTTALTPSRGAYFRKEAPSRGTYSAPNPRCGGGGFSLSRAMEVVVSLFLARLNLLILPKLSILLNLANPPHTTCVFAPKKAHNCAHRAHMHTTPLCVFLCVCVPIPRIWEDNPRWEGGGSLGERWRFPLLPRPNVARILCLTRAGWGGI